MATTIYPLQTLRTLTTEIEAASTLLRVAPEKKPVHRFRTATRRIEAQLLLLDLLPDMPDHAATSRKLARLLRKLRRAAGAVRDLDVQQDMLRQQRPLRKCDDLASSARDLRKLLKHRRTVSADQLLRTLKHRGPKLVTRLESLLADLAEANANPSLTPDTLHQLTAAWYHDRTASLLEATPANSPADDHGSVSQAPQPSDPSRLSTDQLHTARKYAKLARYLAESATTPDQPDTDPLPTLAHHLHQLQQAGGDWHDALILARRARKDLGRHNALTTSLRSDRDRLLLVFQQQLSASQP